MAQSPTTSTGGWNLGPYVASVGLGAAAATMASPTISQPAHYMTAGDMTSAPPTTTASHYVDERLLTAKLEAVEARTETKFAQLIGKIDALGAKLDTVSTGVNEAKTAAGAIKPYVIATGLAIGGIIIALAAFSGQIMQTALALADF